MTTFCILCREPIPPERQRRKANTCSKECKKSYRSQYLSERRGRYKAAVNGKARKRVEIANLEAANIVPSQV